jgi:hypothetical protein
VLEDPAADPAQEVPAAEIPYCRECDPTPVPPGAFPRVPVKCAHCGHCGWCGRPMPENARDCRGK